MESGEKDIPGELNADWFESVLYTRLITVKNKKGFREYIAQIMRTDFTFEDLPHWYTVQIYGVKRHKKIHWVVELHEDVSSYQQAIDMVNLWIRRKEAKCPK